MDLAETAPSVLNASPTGKLTNSGTVKQGQSVEISFTNVSDPWGVGSDGLVYSYDFDGDGKYEIENSLSPKATAPINFKTLSESHIVFGKITDKRGGSVLLSTAVELTDRSPTISVVGKMIGNEGKEYELRLLVSNPGHNPSIDWVVDWGDGKSTRTQDQRPVLTHVYVDNREYTISVSAMDADGLTAKVYVKTQNGSNATAMVTSPDVGELEIVAEGSDIVVKFGTAELFRISAIEIQRLNIVGTPGDDTFKLGKLSTIFAGPVHFEAGTGKNTLSLTGSGHALDLTSIADTLGGINTVDIVGGGHNSLKLDVNAVRKLSQSLRVRHDETSNIEFGNGWVLEKPEIVDNQFVHVLKQDNAKIEIVNTRPYHNPLVPHDVNGDGSIDPRDVLIVINLLNRSSRPDLFSSGGPMNSEELASFAYYDVDGDGDISPLDVLRIINLLNNRKGNGEGEFVANPMRSNDLPIGDPTENQEDLTSLDAAMANWSSVDWSLALVDLGGTIDDDDSDELWGEKGLDLLFDCVGDKVKQ